MGMPSTYFPCPEYSNMISDVCGGLISEEETIIPIRNWIPRDMTPTEAAQLFLASNVYAFDTYANYTVFLCAQTLGVLFGSARLSTYYHGILEDGPSYVDRWQQLLHDVEQWYENRPSQMKPLFSIPTATVGADNDKPFPTVLYGNGAASKCLSSAHMSLSDASVSGNQLYHACALLLLQGKPKTLPMQRRRTVGSCWRAPLAIRPLILELEVCPLACTTNLRYFRLEHSSVWSPTVS